MKEFKGEGNPINLRLIPEKQDEIRAKRKAKILESLQTLIKKEKEKDPNFNISTPFITEVARLHPELFLGLKYRTIMGYFSNDINFLREKLGLPDKGIKKEYW